MFKKLLLSFLAALVLFFSVSTRFASAQTWYYQDFFEWYEKVFDTQNQDEIFGERYTAAQVEWIIYSLMAWAINHVGNADINWCAINLSRNDPGLLKSIIGNVSALINECPCAADDICNLATFADITGVSSIACGLVGKVTCPSGRLGYVPPKTRSESLVTKVNLFPSSNISLVHYLKNFGAKLNLIPEAKAQGFGFRFAANTVQNFWRAVRDLAYLLLAIVIVITAFMIMFRVKLSPQTVISVQSVLPKIVMALILITFSYAIAGFLIDMMYVVLGLLAVFLTSPPGNGISKDSWQTMFTTFTQRGTIGLIVWYWVWWIFAAWSASLQFSGALIGNFVALILMAIIWIILVIVLAIASFKIWWMLIKTYVNILLLIIAAPLYILGGVIGVGGLGAWVTAMVSNLAVYPMVGLLLVLAFVFLATPLGGVSLLPFAPNPQYIISGANAWDPPLTFGSGAVELIMVFVSLFIIMLIPKVAEIIKSVISRRPFAYGTAIGEGLAPVGSLGTGAWGYGLSAPGAKLESLRNAQRGGAVISQATLDRYEKYARWASLANRLTGGKPR